MCGISGIVGFSTSEIRKITSTLEHRGPDQSGFFEDKNVSLGHRRLSIIDLSEKGRQPMSNEDETVWVVFNGEIYNYLQLKLELEQSHSFKSESDTEVLVHGFEEWGITGLVSRLKGDFAFAVWDVVSKRLFLARDRLGVKPLYYAFIEGGLVFASEQKAILSHSGFKRELDLDSLNEYLTFRYVLGPKTLFKGLFKLMPGSYAVFDGKNFLTQKYWDYSFTPSKFSEEALIAKTRVALREAVKSRLMSDVPIGAFLSGGLDSSYVVALMSELLVESSDKVNTFSVGFNNERDETPFARIVAEKFGTNHKEIFVDSSPKILPEVTWHLDEPVADIAALPTYLMSKETKKHATVVLTGDGGDEVFGGYPRYVWLPKLAKVPLPGFASKLAGVIKHAYGKAFADRLSQALSSAGEKDSAKVFLAYASAFSEKEKGLLYFKYFKENVGSTILDKKVASFFAGKPFLDGLLYFDLKTLLPDDYLMKVDKTTMAWGVESRVPYLDEGVLGVVSQIPTSVLVKNFKTKHFMRRVVSNLLPKKIVERKKQGFNVPTSNWLNGDLKEVAEQFLGDDVVKKRGYFNTSAVQTVLQNYSKSKGLYGRQFWSLFAFELWHRVYLDGEITRSPSVLGI